MKTPECQQVTLVEALRDGRLGPQERASVERHVALCADCTSLSRDLEKIGEAVRAPREPLTPLQHQRARLGLLRRASAFSGADVRSAPRRFPAFAAAALSFAAAAGWAGARITTSDEQPLRALHQRLTPQLPALLQTSLVPSGGARYERATSAGLDAVTLTTGALEVNVRPLLSHERFVVKTTDAEIEVRGATLHIEADQGRIKGVTVVEGQAEVRYSGFTLVIPSGGSWRATGDEHAVNEHLPAAPVVKPEAAPVVEPSAPPVAVAAARSSIEARAPREGARAQRERPHATPTPPVVEAPAAVEPTPAPTVAPRAAPTVSPASREFAEAITALGKGDYLKSEKQLDAFAASHPGDPRADEADYLRAIALQRAGKQAEASVLARRYLATRPEGAHRAEAKTIAGP